MQTGKIVEKCHSKRRAVARGRRARSQAFQDRATRPASSRQLHPSVELWSGKEIKAWITMTGVTAGEKRESGDGLMIGLRVVSASSDVTEGGK